MLHHYGPRDAGGHNPWVMQLALAAITASAGSQMTIDLGIRAATIIVIVIVILSGSLAAGRRLPGCNQ